MLEPVEEGSEPPNKFPGEQPSIGKLRMTTKKFDEAMSNPRCITNGETPRLVELKILTLASRPPVCKSNFWGYFLCNTVRDKSNPHEFYYQDDPKGDDFSAFLWS